MSKWILPLATFFVGFIQAQAIIASEVAPFIPGEIVVKLKPGVTIESLSKDKSFQDMNVISSREIKLSYQKLFVLKIKENKSFSNVINFLNNNSNIEYAEPNYLYHAAVMPKERFHKPHKKILSPFEMNQENVPDDPSFKDLWGLKNTGVNEPNGKAGIEGADINALKAWDLSRGNHQVRIAVIDTGIDSHHPDLIGNVDAEHGFNFINNSKDAMDDNGHGTHCAGTIGAIHDNKLGVAGVMSEVTLIPLKFLDSDGSGSLEDAVKAIDYATELNVDIMSNSWGGGGKSQAMFEAIQRASNKGIIFTAAAGNNGTSNDSSPSYPASYEVPNIISVAAVTAQNDLAYFSSYGRTTVHIAAPGQNILSTTKKDSYEVLSGTSMATPHVSGALGLLIAKEGRMPHEVLKERLMLTGIPVAALRGKTLMASRMDAYNLLTDTRPERTGPKKEAWRVVKLDEIFESTHPYKENSNQTKKITVQGAKYIRVKVPKFELESGYDYVRIANAKGDTIEKVTGVGENYTSDYVEGDSVVLNFISDRSINKWGFKIEEIEVQ